MKSWHSLLFLSALAPLAARADLLIQLDFDQFYSSAPSAQDVNQIFNGASLAEAQEVIVAAANYWQTAFANSASNAGFAVNGRITQEVSVSWDSLFGGALANGGSQWYVSSDPSENGTLVNGSLRIDNDKSSTFFVDKTPWEHSEWRDSSSRSAALNGVNINIERTHFNAPPGVVRDNNDLLSVMVHELGHTLGYLSPYPYFVEATSKNPGFLTISSGQFAGAELVQNGSHLENQLPRPDKYPYDANFGEFSYGPQNMDASIYVGTRGTLTAADIAGLAEVLKFDMSTVNFNPMIQAVPEPSTYGVCAGAGLIGLAWVRRRRRTA